MADALQLQDELLAMDEYKRLAVIQQFHISLHIFEGNTREMCQLLDAGRTPPSMFQLDAYQREVARRLHNFVASAFTLVYHARSFYNKNYKDDTRFADYENEVKKRFEKDPLHEFVQGLRNYCIHWKVPPIATELHVNMTDGTAEHGIFLNRAKLYEWKEWRAPAKSYLASAGNYIDLVDVIHQYTQKVHAFYTWVHERLEEIHRTDLDAVQRKQREARRALGQFIPFILTHQVAAHAKTGQAPEGMFATFMDPTRLREICGRYPDPAERANALVDGCADYADISADLRKQIVDVFIKFHQREGEPKTETTTEPTAS